MSRSQNFSDWLGRMDTPPPDFVSPRLISKFQATLAPVLGPTGGAPLGIHWCLFSPDDPEKDLGDDGHPCKGGFLPPIPLPRRMWAGGEVEFLAPIQSGDTIEKTSEISKITNKTGKTGALCFVTVAHEYTCKSRPVIREKQHIVYREAASEPLQLPDSLNDASQYDYVWDFPITPVTLFRYSALTFNAHRIHYDHAYAQNTEMYPDLVIHGPLQATALLNFAADLKKQCPRFFRYRALAPALGRQNLELGAAFESETHCRLGVLTETGVKTMEATAEW